MIDEATRSSAALSEELSKVEFSIPIPKGPERFAECRRKPGREEELFAHRQRVAGVGQGIRLRNFEDLRGIGRESARGAVLVVGSERPGKYQPDGSLGRGKRVHAGIAVKERVAKFAGMKPLP